jgi:hypothetical protein
MFFPPCPFQLSRVPQGEPWTPHFSDFLGTSVCLDIISGGTLWRSQVRRKWRAIFFLVEDPLRGVGISSSLMWDFASISQVQEAVVFRYRGITSLFV